MLCLLQLACAASPTPTQDAREHVREQVLIDLDPGGLIWTGLDVDDDLALLIGIALNRSSSIELIGLTTCGGNAPIKHAAPGLDLLLRTAGIGASDLPAGIGRGHGWQSMHVPWPNMRRLSALSPDEPSSDEAAELIISAAHASGPHGLTIVTLGPPTNLAAALAKAPEIAPKLRRVLLMGGQLDKGGRMCLNFMSDRAAARAVLASPVPTTIVPIQTCAQASFTAAHVSRLEAKCCGGKKPAAVCALLTKMTLQTRVMPWLVNQHVTRRKRVASAQRPPPSKSLESGFIPWDVVAILAAFHPRLFDGWELHRVSVPTCAGAEPCNGTMIVDPNALSPAETMRLAGQDREAHRNVALIPYVLVSEEALLDTAIDLLCAVPAAGEFADARPPYLLGFLKEAAVLGLLVVAVVLTAVKRCVDARRGARTKAELARSSRVEGLRPKRRPIKRD